MNDLNIPFFRKTMFAGMATLFLSTGVTQANPVSAGEEVTEKHAAALPLQKKVTITGVVKDALGPVVGANVVEKGTTNGTVTDMEGRFSLQVSSNAVLIISYIGYIDQAIPVNGKSSFTVLLKEDSQALDEVVVVGYGTQKKVNMTGAVASVDMSKMVDSRPITSLSAGLAGMAPGVDRMIMLLKDEENIREVIAFPMNSNAQDLLLGAPNTVSEQQLREVHIKLRRPVPEK